MQGPGRAPRVADGVADGAAPVSGGRRRAYLTIAAVMALLCGLGFVALTALTLALWLAGQDHATTPVGDLGFLALGGVMLGLGFGTQAWSGARTVAGLQQAVIAVLALAVAGFLGGRVEPFWGGLLVLCLALVMAALHPRRGTLLRLGARPNPALLALGLIALVPAVLDAAHLLDLARGAGPSCFLGRCATGDRYAELAAVVIATALLAVLAGLRTSGWPVPGWSAAIAAVLIGVPAITLPSLPGSAGPVWGTAAVVWGVVVGVITERDRRRERMPAPVRARREPGALG